KIKEMKTKQLIEGLYTSSTVDALTGALNRKGLQDKLFDLITKCRDYGKDISIILFDIDGFKLINDTYGHLVGDLVLKELSETVRKTIREDDVFVRWGGDEFLLITMISLNQALHIANRLRKNVESRLFSGMHVTISIGISQYLPDEPFERAIERADKALYNSKSRGKNSVSVERR
ncbi:MAG: GGDEF domain-containing protein, partial [Acetomicrobium sp.]|nr:GGDEF domain-containing protein [Acetomicrobium sp.]